MATVMMMMMMMLKTTTAYCKVRNISVELLLATLASGFRFANITIRSYLFHFPRFFVNIWRHACDDFDPFNIVFSQ